MNPLLTHTSAWWTRYSDYQWKQAPDGQLYLLPASDATPNPYNMLTDPGQLVLDAVRVGQVCMKKTSTRARQMEAIKDFVCKYGLMGIMTALPTTAKFVEYSQVYLPKNELLREEVMGTLPYMQHFFPFKAPEFKKHGLESLWNLSDRTMIALAMTFQEVPQAVSLSFMRDYGERYDWLVTVFRSFAFGLTAAFLYELDKDATSPQTLQLYNDGLAGFEDNAPSYHLVLQGKPQMVWDFHSLLLCVKLLFSTMLTDDEHPLRMCRKCKHAFVAKADDQVVCNHCM